MQATFHRARRHADDLRNLAFREVLEVAQHEHLAQGFRQPGQTLLRVELGVEGRRPAAVGSLDLGLQSCLLSGFDQASPRTVAAEIVGDLKQPGREASGR